MPLRETDVRTIATWLGPDYVLAAAEAHGKGDVVAGTPGAYAEVRQQIRSYLSYVLRRDRETVRELAPGQTLRALGWDARPTPLAQVYDEALSSRLMARWWPVHPEPIPGWLDINTGDRDQRAVNKAVLHALQLCPDGVVHLRGGTYQHLARPPVWVSVSMGIRDVALVPVTGTKPGWKQITAGMRRLINARRHPLYHVSVQLALAWARHEPIYSPGVFLISFVGDRGVEAGWAAIPPGFSATVTVGRVQQGRVRICASFDHRAFGGVEAGEVYQFLRERVGG